MERRVGEQEPRGEAAEATPGGRAAAQPASARPAAGAPLARCHLVGGLRPALDVLLLAGLLAGKASLFAVLVGLPGGLPAWLSNAGLALLATLPLQFLRPGARPRRLGLVLAYLLVTLLLLADVWYFRYFGDILSVHMILQLGIVGSVSASVLDLVRPQDLLLLLDAPLLVLLVRTAPPAGRRRWPVAVLSLLVAATLIGLPIVQRARIGGLGMYRNVWSRVFFVTRSGILLCHLQDGASAARDHLLAPAAPSAAERERLAAWYAVRDRPKPPSPLAGRAAGQSVILVQLEALQAQVIGLEVAGRPVTPHLNRLLTESLYFPRFYHQTAQGRTADAEYLTLCSQHPLAEGAVFFRFPRAPVSCLPRLLALAGYRTEAFHAFDRAFWNRATVYPQLGFARFHSRDELPQTEIIGLGLSDRVFFATALQRLRALPQPFFAFLVTLSSHHPYPDAYPPADLSLGALDGTSVGRYLKAMHYLDASLGHFVEGLRAAGLLDRAVLIALGDHDLGALSDPAGHLPALFGPAPPGTPAGLDFWRRVPLLIRLPHGEAAGRYPQLGGQLDLLPTVLELLDLTPPRFEGFGTSLLTGGPRTVVFRDGTVLDEELSYFPPGQTGRDVGVCRERRTGAEVPVARCASLVQHAAAELTLSELVTRYGLRRDEPRTGPATP